MRKCPGVKALTPSSSEGKGSAIETSLNLNQYCGEFFEGKFNITGDRSKVSLEAFLRQLPRDHRSVGLALE